jgi:hypothetical protein
VTVEEEEVRESPRIPLAAIADPGARQALLAVIVWAANEARRADL